MKLEAKHRLQSFNLTHLLPSTSNAIKRLGERYRSELEWVHGASSDPALTVGFLHHETKQIVFYVFYKRICQGGITFDFMEGRAVAKQANLNVSNVATPHAVLDTSVRGKSISSFLYRRALNSGITLVTGAHTEMASQLWERLGNQFNLYHFEAGKVVPNMTPTSIKILTKKVMK